MRIISDFKDYYDCGQQYGFDPKLIYNRKIQHIDVELNIHGWFKHCSELVIIGFCGKLYPVVLLKTAYRNDVDVCYSIEDVDQFAHAYLTKKELGDYYADSFYRFSYRGFGNRIYYQNLFGKVKDFGLLHSLFIQYHTPIFSIIRNNKTGLTHGKFGYTLSLNIKLKDFYFYRVFDSYSAYQELSMYYGGVLGGIKEVVPDVPDKVLVDAKGFDKYSFRKDKK